MIRAVVPHGVPPARALASAFLVSLGAGQQGEPAPEALEAIVAYVREHAEPPSAVVFRAFESHRVVFLGDVHPAAEPKRLVAELVPELRARGLLDVLVLEVPYEQQPVIDAYLASDPEDVSLLVDHPLTLRAHWGAAREYLEIYRAVWFANRAPPAARRIRIVAADAPRGPPQMASEMEAVARYARRDAVMASRILQEVLSRDRGAHVLIFMGGYHGLKNLYAEVEWNGARARVQWAASRLQERWPEPIYTILTDGAPEPAPYRTGPSYGATRLFALLQERVELSAPFAVPVTPLFDAIPSPLLEPGDGPIQLRFVPDGYKLHETVDAYFYLGVAEPITPLETPPSP